MFATIIWYYKNGDAAYCRNMYRAKKQYEHTKNDSCKQVHEHIEYMEFLKVRTFQSFFF